MFYKIINQQLSEVLLTFGDHEPPDDSRLVKKTFGEKKSRVISEKSVLRKKTIDWRLFWEHRSSEIGVTENA